MFDQDVVIIGGGIAGCSSALFLQRAGHKVHVYERAEEILPVGAAISVWSNGVKVMNRLGLGKEMQQHGGQMDRMVYKLHDGTPCVDVDLSPVYQTVGERAYPIARGYLQKLLMDTYVNEGGKLTLGKTCVGVEPVDPNDPDTRVRAVFDDGSKSKACDLLLAADGIKSVIRDYVLQRPTEISYHYTNWNGLIPKNPAIGKPNDWIMFVGEGKRASVMPIGGDQFYFFMGAPLKENAPPPPRGEAMRQELKEIFKNFPSNVQALIDSIDVKKSLNRIPICDHDPLDRVYRGRVCLIGDSMHSTTPTLGQGGCQALEDAEVLSSFINTTNVSMADALQRYAQHRLDRVHTMVEKARERTATIYPTDESSWNRTKAWYNELVSDPQHGPNILAGITNNLLQGPWPPRAKL